MQISWAERGLISAIFWQNAAPPRMGKVGNDITGPAPISQTLTNSTLREEGRAGGAVGIGAGSLRQIQLPPHWHTLDCRLQPQEFFVDDFWAEG